MRKAHLILTTALAMLSCLCSAENDTNSLSPKEYSVLHLVASNPQDPKWTDSMRKLTTLGDAFTLVHLKPLEAQKLDASQAAILKETLSSTRQRVAEEDDKAFTKLIQLRLERAVWADLSCNRLEGSLVPWTLKLMRQHLETSSVVAELERIQSDYLPAAGETPLYGAMQERVRRYARQLLGK